MNRHRGVAVAVRFTGINFAMQFCKKTRGRGIWTSPVTNSCAMTSSQTQSQPPSTRSRPASSNFLYIRHILKEAIQSHICKSFSEYPWNDLRSDGNKYLELNYVWNQQSTNKLRAVVTSPATRKTTHPRALPISSLRSDRQRLHLRLGLPHGPHCLHVRLNQKEVRSPYGQDDWGEP